MQRLLPDCFYFNSRLPTFSDRVGWRSGVGTLGGDRRGRGGPGGGGDMRGHVLAAPRHARRQVRLARAVRAAARLRRRVPRRRTRVGCAPCASTLYHGIILHFFEL